LETTTILAVKAFFNALPYASQNFIVQFQRDYIMDRLFDAFKCSNEDIRVVAMQTLVEIGRQEYESVQYFFEKVCEVTAYCAKNDDENVGA
jgi:hypothetical protein